MKRKLVFTLVTGQDTGVHASSEVKTTLFCFLNDNFLTRVSTPLRFAARADENRKSIAILESKILNCGNVYCDKLIKLLI